MRFKEYLIREDTQQPLKEELIQGGLFKLFKRLEYWFDFDKQTTEERIHHLEQSVIFAGGVAKFSMIIRRLPAVKHFLVKHRGELSGDLARVAKNMDTRFRSQL